MRWSCVVWRVGRDRRWPAAKTLEIILNWRFDFILLTSIDLYRRRLNWVRATNAMGFPAIVGEIIARVLVAQHPRVPSVQHRIADARRRHLEKRVAVAERPARSENAARRDASIAFTSSPGGSNNRRGILNGQQQMTRLSCGIFFGDVRR